MSGCDLLNLMGCVVGCCVLGIVFFVLLCECCNLEDVNVYYFL